VKIHRIPHLATLGLTVAAVAAPTAVAYEDYAPQHPRTTQDLVSPDARDRTRAASTADAPNAIDRRSPDAKDTADGRGTWNAPNVTVVRVPEAQSVPSSTGLHWGDAGIGAGAMLGLILLALGSILAVVHRRQSAAAGQPATTA
jgi:hypothetical protein